MDRTLISNKDLEPLQNFMSLLNPKALKKITRGAPENMLQNAAYNCGKRQFTYDSNFTCNLALSACFCMTIQRGKRKKKTLSK